MSQKHFEFKVTTFEGIKEMHSIVGSEEDVRNFCAQRNLFLISIRQIPNEVSEVKKIKKAPKTPKVNQKKKEESLSSVEKGEGKKVKKPLVFFKFVQMLSKLLNKHLTLTQAFRMMLETSKSSKLLNKSIHQIQGQISQGVSLHEAVDLVFLLDKGSIGLIRVGEETGTLKRVLSDLSDSLEKSRKFKKSVSDTLIYPVILVITSMISVIILFLFVIPRFVELFQDMNQKLPTITKVVFLGSQFLQNYFLIILLGGGSIVAILYCLHFYRPIRIFYEKVLFFNPILGFFFRKSVTQSQCHFLAIMIKSGLLLPHSFRLLIPSQQFILCQKEIRILLSGIEEGNKLSELIQKSSFYPDLLGYFVSIGEENGDLGQGFDDISQIYEEEISSFLKGFMTLLSPMIIIVMGGFIAVVILSVIIPAMSLTNIQS